MPLGITYYSLDGAADPINFATCGNGELLEAVVNYVPVGGEIWQLNEHDPGGVIIDQQIATAPGVLQRNAPHGNALGVLLTGFTSPTPVEVTFRRAV